MPDDVPSRTIPEVLRDAAARDPDGIWVRSDGGSLSFGAALAQVARTARLLRDAGVSRGDLVMVTARTTPPYLICWLALASLGAVTVSVNPRSAPAELAGLAGQTQPRALITDQGLAPLVRDAQLETPPLGVLDVGELTRDWASAAAAGPAAAGPEAGPAGEPELGTGVAPGDLAVLIPTSAPPAGPSWSCRRTGPTCWPVRDSPTGWG